LDIDVTHVTSGILVAIGGVNTQQVGSCTSSDTSTRCASNGHYSMCRFILGSICALASNGELKTITAKLKYALRVHNIQSGAVHQ
jgi:hypothetical protein